MSQQDVGKPGRIRGFESPLSRNQKASWIGNVVATGGFYVVCGVASCEDTFIALGVHLIFVILGASCWIFLETHDPTQESCFSKLLPDSERWTKVRYSREHKKVVAGLDHYCTWLNVAVCRSNYLPFYLLSLFGTAQYALHVVIMIIILTSCDAGSQQIGLVFFAAAWLVLGALLLFPYASLASFHTFLCYHRMGTYDWIMQQRQAETQQQQGSSSTRADDDDDATEICGCFRRDPSPKHAREQQGA